jgi:transcriptional regulator with XRE-family HTH domain
MIINITTFDLLLRDRGMTQTALAQRARLGAKTIGRIRRGEVLRISNAKKIAEALGVSLDELNLPPSEELQEKSRKKSGLSRLVADLSDKSLNALTLASKRYQVSEHSILKAAPFMFMILAELSLKRRRDKLEEWKDAALSAVGSGPRNHRHYSIEGIEEAIWELYEREACSIDKRDLSAGFTGTHPERPTQENPGHAFMTMLEEMAAESGHTLTFVDSTPDDYEPFNYDAYNDAVDEFLDPDDEYGYCSPDEDACLLIADGQIPLRDMPEELLASGSGPDRRAWVINHPNYGPYGSRIDETDEVTVAEDSQRANDAGNGGSNA